MEVSTKALKRALVGLACLALCLPLLLASLIVTGGGDSDLPILLALAAVALVVVAGIWGRRRIAAALPAVALFAVLASAAFDTAHVETQRELAAARFGLPFEFVEAELTVTPALPYDTTWNPWEDPGRILAKPLLASFAAVLAGLGLLALAASAAVRAAASRSAPRPPA